MPVCTGAAAGGQSQPPESRGSYSSTSPTWACERAPRCVPPAVCTKACPEHPQQLWPTAQGSVGRKATGLPPHCREGRRSWRPGHVELLGGMGMSCAG